MPPWVVALLFAAGFATWVFSKTSNKTGGNNRDSVIVAAVAGFFGFLLLLVILSAVDNYLSN